MFAKIKNKKVSLNFFLVYFVIAGILLFSSVLAASQKELDLSAYIINQKNQELTNGDHKVRFAIYTTDRKKADSYPSNSDQGKRVWEETQTIKIQNGILNATLGTKNPLPDNLTFNDQDYYLGIRIDNDSEMIPRKKITAVPLAINSSYLNGATLGSNEGNIPQLGTNGLLDKNFIPKITKLGVVNTGVWEGDTITSNYIADALSGKTYNGLDLTSNSDGFSIEGGTTSRTLSITGTDITLNQNLSMTSTPAFSGLTLSNLNGILKASSGVISGSATTSDLSEGTNLYYTDARARASISATGALSYSSVTGVINLNAPIPIVYGGTNSTSIGSVGSVPYSTGSAYGFTDTGTSGQVLVSSGSGAPAWGTVAGGTIAADSLDFTELKDTLTLDANLLFDSSASNYSFNFDSGTLFVDSLNNRVGIGTTAPTAVLHLKAGTATASTAPLKFTSGTNLTTAEAGAMEYDGTSLFFSPSTTRLRTVLTDNSIPSNGMLAIGNGTNYTNATLTGTTDQITVTNGAGTITLSTPQSIATSSTPQFARLGLGTAADATNILTATSASTTDLSKTLNITHTGAITGTGYAGYFSKTGASTTNVGLYATASGATNNYAAIFDGGNVGIGTTAPLLKFDVFGSGRFTGAATSVLTGTINPIASQVITGVGTLFTKELVVGDRITVTGETRTVIAIASDTSLTVDTATTDTANDTSPDKLAAVFVARDSSNEVQMLVNDVGLTSINNLEIGALNFDTDAGAVSWVDMPISAASSGTVESYTANIAGSPVMTVYGLSNGSGGVTNLGVGIGTVTPTGNLDITQTIATTGALKGIVYTGAVNTNQTLSTEIPSLTLTTAGRQWATGALATQREVLITQPTYSFVGASTITDAATLGIAGAPIKSTNATITNTHGLLIQAGAVSTAVNSYGLTVNAQTGATNNYSAAFLGGNVGIGTTAPTALLHLNGTAGTVPFEVNSNETTTTNNVLMLRSDVASADDAIFRVQANGAVYADGAYTGTGADYAEYFFTQDSDLKSGETVCVDTQKENAVKRCVRSGDNDVMGIVSKNPSIIGNNGQNRENNPNYKVIAMLGQINGNATNENGPIAIGDSLTPASTPGYLRKASPEESTVGVALQNFNQTKGSLQIMISRRNKSLTVEKVEEAVTQRIADMNVEDQVNNIVNNATTKLTKNMETQLTALNNKVTDLEKLTAGYETKSQLQEELTKTIQAQIIELQKQTNQELNLAQLDLNTNDISYLKQLLGIDNNKPGDVSILGKFTAEKVETGMLVIIAKDEEKKTIGAASILPKPVDEDEDGIDDVSKNPIIESDGKSAVVKTKAVEENSKIFVTPKVVIGEPLAVTEIKAGESFKVEVKSATDKSIEFDWWIVESQ